MPVRIFLPPYYNPWNYHIRFANSRNRRDPNGVNRGENR